MSNSGASSSASIQAQRHALGSLLVPRDPADARTAYYALQYDVQRTALTLHHTDSGYVDGFAATCITGANPFQPLVVLRALGPGTLEALIHDALVPGGSYLFSVPVHVGAALEGVLALSDVTVWRILTVDPSRFVPLINVFVTQEQGTEGRARWQISLQDRIVALAGVNWQSSDWAEVYVACEPAAHSRRWDESVLSAATAALLARGVAPLYLVPHGDSRAQRVAELRGYHDTGSHEFTCAGVVPPREG